MMFKPLLFASCLFSGAFAVAVDKKITWNPLGKSAGGCSSATVKAIRSDVYDAAKMAKAALKDLANYDSPLYKIMFDGRGSGNSAYGDNKAANIDARFKKMIGVFDEPNKNPQWLYISCVDTMNLCSTGAQSYYDPNLKSIIVCQEEYMKLKMLSQLDCNGDTNNILSQATRAAMWVNMYTRWESVRKAASKPCSSEVRCCAAGPASAQWLAKNEPDVAVMNGESYGWYAQQAYMFHTKCNGKIFKQHDIDLRPSGIDPVCEKFMTRKDFQAYAIGL